MEFMKNKYILFGFDLEIYFQYLKIIVKTLFLRKKLKK